jgi:glycerophosphoryl diester phosphodiesterase
MAHGTSPLSAWRNGRQRVETDVTSPNGSVVLIHDHTVDHTTDNGYVKDLTSQVIAGCGKVVR